jgi:hypothetical protein
MLHKPSKYLVVHALVSRRCSSVQLTLSSLAWVNLSSSWFSTYGDWKAMSTSSIASEPKTMKYGEMLVL